MLNKAALNGQIHGVSIAKDAPKINNLFFTNDSILFSRANDQEACVIVDILNKYEGLSGQQINVDKSELSFSRGLIGVR